MTMGPPTAAAEVLGALRQAPPLLGWRFNPAAFVRAVNTLVGLGESKAIEALRLSAVELRHDPDAFARLGGLVLLARLLWSPGRDGNREMLSFGQPDLDLPPPDAVWPLTPLVLWRDLPFLLVGGYRVGAATAGLEEVLQRLAEAHWNGRRLAPGGNPLDAPAELIASPEFSSRIPTPHQPRVRAMVTAQALYALADALPVSAADLRQLESAAPETVGGVAALYRERAEACGARWSEKAQRFVAA